MGTNVNVNLHKAFRDTNYYVDVTPYGGKSSCFWPVDVDTHPITKTFFYSRMTSNNSNLKGIRWYACGY